MTNKHKFIAFLLGCIFGPLGFIYLGWRHVIMSFIALAIFVSVLLLINIPLFDWAQYITLPIMGFCAYGTANKINSFIEEERSNQNLDLSVLRSFAFSAYEASGLLQFFAMAYSLVIGVYASVLAFDESVFTAALVLFIGTPVIIWISGIVFGFIGKLFEVPFMKRITKEIES